MEDCLFCKIAAGEIPSNKLFEDDKLLAFYDIDPQAPVHFLVIPKQHIASAAALTEDDAALTGEAADLVFHLTILLAERGLGWDGIAAELARRHGTSGHAEKAARNQ